MHLNSRISVASVSSLWPTVTHREHGVFVRRRLGAMAELSDVRVMRPIPWFPGVRPLSPERLSVTSGLRVDDRRMFYLPLVMKHLDSHWVDRCVSRAVGEWEQSEWPDLIDAHFGFPTGVGCFRVGRRLGIPVFITLRGVEETDIQDKRIGPQLVEALTHCAGVVAVSDSLKKAAVEHGVPEGQIRVIPNAVEMKHFQPGDKAAARRQLGLPAESRIIVAVGSLIRRKRHHVLAAAFQKVLAQFRDARLVIVGGEAHEPAYPNSLRRTIDEFGLSDSVLLAGQADPDAIKDWLHAADVFSLATAREGCCNAVLEALACGLPVVTTAAGDNERYVAPPRNGLIVPIDDSQALATALCVALERDWDGQAISRSVCSRGWDDVARETLEFFQERLADCGRSRNVPATTT